MLSARDPKVFLIKLWTGYRKLISSWKTSGENAVKPKRDVKSNRTLYSPSGNSIFLFAFGQQWPLLCSGPAALLLQSAGFFY